jgi:hypothetical protein
MAKKKRPSSAKAKKPTLKSKAKRAVPTKERRVAPPTKAKRVAMPGNQRFDRSAYALPLLGLPDAIALATALLAVKPAGTSASLGEEAKRLAAARDRAKALGKGAGGDDADARSYDVAMDRAWSTFVRRVGDFAELPMARHAGATEASRVYAIVKDLSILELNYLAEFAQIGARIVDLKREGLLDAAREFAGAAFVDEVLHCHAAYGTALGVGDEKARDRADARLSLLAALGDYTFQVLALARAGRPESWTHVRASLRPIVELRARQAQAPRTLPKRPPPHPPIAPA